MKKITKNIISKSILLFLFVTAQVQAWAFDGRELENDPGKWRQAIAMPGFWIGTVLFIVCIAAFFLVGRERKENQLQ